MAKAWSVSQNKLVDVSDEEYGNILNSAGQMPQPTGTQPAPPAAQPSAGKPINPYGWSLQQLYQGLGKARAARDTRAVNEFEGLISDEEGYIKTQPEPEDLKDPFAAQKVSARQSLELLKRRYGRGDAEKLGGGEDLSLAERGGIFSRQKAAIKAGGSKLVTGQLEQDINKYKNILDTFRGTFTQAFGSGTPQEAEALALMKAAPKETSTDQEAQAWFDDVDSLLSGKLPETPPDLGTGKIEEESKKKEGKGIDFQDIAGKVAGAMPVVGGIAGGVSGGILGGVAGSIVPGGGTAAGAIAGSAGGTALGTGTGVFVQNAIEEIAGTQDDSSAEVLKDAFGEAATAGLLDVATLGAFKLVGAAGKLVLKPIGKAIAQGIKSIPLRSLRINPSQLTQFSKKHGVDMGEFVVKNRLLGENAVELGAAKAGELQKAFDNLALAENIKIPIDNLDNRFLQEIADLAPAPGKLVPSAFKGIAKNVTDEWAALIGQMKNQGIRELDAKMLTELRRFTDDLIPESAFVDPSVKNVAMRLRNIYNDVVQEAVDKTLLAPVAGGAIEDTGLKSLGRELSKYYDFLRMAEKQSNLGRGSLVPNLTRILLGGFGALAGGIPGIAVGLGTEAALRSPEILSKIYSAGKKLPGISAGVGKAVDVFSKVVSPVVGAGGAAILP